MQFLDLKVQYKSIEKEINEAINRVLNNCVFINGQEVKEFENKIENFAGVKYAIGVNSGTDALFLSLRSLKISPGDEVITTPFTFIATAEVIANCGAKPVFVDIEPKTFNINPKKIEEKITKKTKAILPVHLFGQMAEMSKIMKIARKYKLKVIEDAAQTIGAKYKNRMAGSIGDLGCFSFFPAKNLGAYGDGGMIVTNNKKLADKIKLFRNHGSSPKEKYINLILGENSRLDTIQSAILKIKLKYLQKWNRTRAKNASCYSKFLQKTGDIITPIIERNQTHTFHQYTIRTKHRDKLQKFLKQNGISTMIYYPLPLYLQPALKYLGCKKNDFPEIEKAAKEVLSLPIYPELLKKDQDFIIAMIKKFYEKKD